MSIVLDTGIFYRPDALRNAARLEDDIVVPAVAYMERLRQLVRDGGSRETFDRFLQSLDCAVQPFTRTEAARFAPLVSQDAWKRLARDAMIAGHVGPEDVLWTTNARDFLAIGVPANQVLAVA
jgi:predicted nucleic acid-binding protein